MASDKAGLKEIISGLRDNFELMYSSGVTGLYSSGATLEDLLREAEGCSLCGLHQSRSALFFGVGNAGARVVFVLGAQRGGAAGPFDGEEGELLMKMIRAMGLDEGRDVYVCPAVKCVPREGCQDADSEAVSSCSALLKRQIKALHPEVVVAFGGTASLALLGSGDVEALRGRFHDLSGTLVISTYEPAMLLKKEALKREVWKDLKKVMGVLKRP